jgi:hypothetical protein
VIRAEVERFGFSLERPSARRSRVRRSTSVPMRRGRFWKRWWRFASLSTIRLVMTARSKYFRNPIGQASRKLRQGEIPMTAADGAGNCGRPGIHDRMSAEGKNLPHLP